MVDTTDEEEGNLAVFMHLGLSQSRSRRLLKFREAWLQVPMECSEFYRRLQEDFTKKFFVIFFY